MFALSETVLRPFVMQTLAVGLSGTAPELQLAPSVHEPDPPKAQETGPDREQGCSASPTPEADKDHSREQSGANNIYWKRRG